MPKKRKHTVVVKADDAPELLCGRYPRTTYVADEGGYFAKYQAAYHIGQLTLCLRNDKSAMINVTTLRKRLDNAFAIRDLDRVVKGVEQLSKLTDWDKAEQTCQTITPESERLYLECDRIWSEYFGATFLWFQRLFQVSIQEAIEHTKAIERSAF